MSEASDLDELNATMENLTMIMSYKKDATAFLESQGIRPANPIIEHRPACSNIGNLPKTTIRTNMFKINVKEPKQIYKYRLVVEGIRFGNDEQEHMIDFSEGTGNEFFALERRTACSFIFDAAVVIHADFFGDRKQLYYDARSLLYSTSDLECKEPRRLEFSLQQLCEAFGQPTTNMDLVAHFHNSTNFTITVTRDPKQSFFKTDLASLVGRENLEAQDSELVHFSDVVTSQDIMEERDDHVTFPGGRSLFLEPGKFGFTVSNSPQFENIGIYMAAGLTKSSRLVEEGPGVSLVVEPKLALLHTLQSLSDKLANLLEPTHREQANHIIRGIYVYAIHLLDRRANPRLLVAQVVGLAEPANVTTFERDGQNITVADYFAQTYPEHPLKHPEWPTVTCRQNGRDVLYPLELCIVLDNQRVAARNMSGDLVALLIRQTALPPRTLQARTLAAFNSMQLNNSDFLHNAGIEIVDRPTDVEALILPAPSPTYANRPSKFEAHRNTWETRDHTYIHPCPDVPSWCLFLALRGPVNNYGRMDERDLNAFLVEYTRTCQAKGSRLRADACYSQVLDLGRSATPKADQLYEALQAAVSADCKFALVITNKADTPIHACLKAYEQQLGIVTQNVTSANALAAAGIRTSPRRLTMENIVNKSNVKCGGLNYQLSSERQRLGETDLFLGFALNHVAGGLANMEDTEVPTILGYAANDLVEPIAFTGDFIYHHPSRQGDLASFDRAINSVFKRYMTNRQAAPQRVFVYRNGCSEGEMRYVLQFEAPLIEARMTQHFGEGKSKLVLIVSNRLHNVRFTPVEIPSTHEKPRDQNIQPGVVIDRDITHPSFPEFYLAGHRAQQGTAKIPRYVVLVNQPKLFMDEITRITFSLCFAHQIINSPVSLPSPVYIAEEYAKRGRNLYNARANSARIHGREAADLTDVLAYQCAGLEELRNKRVNA